MVGKKSKSHNVKLKQGANTFFKFVLTRENFADRQK